jgi:outer membrane protein assembly factor BamB
MSFGSRVARLAAAVIVLLALALPATAAPSKPLDAAIRLSKTDGPPGTYLAIAGSGYQAGDTISITEDNIPLYSVPANPDGTFGPTRIQIKTFFGPGQMPIAATGSPSGATASRTFTIRTNWPQFHATPNHQGNNPYENVLGPGNVSLLVQLWKGPTNNFFALSSPIVYKGVVYVGSGDHNLYAFAEGGCNGQPVCQPLWTGATGGFIDATPAIAGKSVIVASSDGTVSAFRALGCGQATCQPVWTAQTGAAIEASPTVNGEALYVGSSDGNLYAFKAKGCGQATCQPVWTGTAGGPVTSSPAVADGRVYVGVGASVEAFPAAGCGQATCSPMWTTATGGPTVTSSPAVANHVLYAGSDDHKLYAMNGATGAVQWTATTGDVVQSSPAVAYGMVFVGSFDHSLYVFDAAGCGRASCQPLWKGTTGGVIFGSPSVANGLVFVVSNDGKVQAFDASGCGHATCSSLWNLPAPGEASPPVVDSQVFASGQDGNLYAFGFPGLGR